MTDGAPINVLHLTPQLSRGGGGASAYLWGLSAAMAACGVASHVAGVADQWTAQDTRHRTAASIFAGKPFLGPAMGFSRALRRYLENDLPPVDLVHSHGLRNGIGLKALSVARRRNLPLLITPHGMLYEPLLQRGRLKKWIVNRLWDDRYRAAADVLHATSDAEAKVIRASGATQPIAVVPIGVDLALLAQPSADRRGDRKTLLFLGIMDRKKGLLRLAQAWGALHREFPDWRLVIAGPDSDGHADEVRDALKRAGAAGATTFLGPVYGEEKARLYRESNLFVLPTDWENFGIAVAEALASEVPVITTHGAPWLELQTHNCGWWIEPTTVTLHETLRQAMQLPDDERQNMGKRGRDLVQSRYAWPAIARRMRELYEWMLKRGERPPFVQFSAATPRSAIR